MTRFDTAKQRFIEMPSGIYGSKYLLAALEAYHIGEINWENFCNAIEEVAELITNL